MQQQQQQMTQMTQPQHVNQQYAAAPAVGRKTTPPPASIQSIRSANPAAPTAPLPERVPCCEISCLCFFLAAFREPYGGYAL